MVSKKMVINTVSAVALSLGMAAAARAASLVNNGSFDVNTGNANYNPFGSTGKKRIQTNGVVNNDLIPGWTENGGVGVINELVSPGNASLVVDSDGTHYPIPTYAGFPATSPDLGNFFGADGNPSFSGSISQSISGLLVGRTYAVSFYQALGEQTGFVGQVSGDWMVSLGGNTLTSSLMTQTPAGNGSTGGFVDWNSQTLNFTATATTETLSFLATGFTNPTNPNGPPIVFLDGVQVNFVPLPSALSVGFVGMLGIAAYHARQCAKSKTRVLSH